MLIDRSAVLGLAPATLTSMRSGRYRGDDQAVRLEDFGAADRASIAFLYDELQALKRADGVDDFLSTHDLAALATRAASIGGGQQYRAHVATAAHDLRGGALTALLLELGAPVGERLSPRSLETLTRDCLKMMRNLLVDIDVPGRARDLEHRLHSLSDLVAALESYQGTTALGRARLELQADAQATIAASCTELGTIERVAFNLLGNAATHSQSGAIEAWLVVVGDHLRVAIANDITVAHRDRLGGLLREDGSVLYSTFSTSGSGFGLQIAAELVGRAYGVEEVRELVARGYVGTKLVDDAFVSWFHWPLAEHASNPELVHPVTR